VVQKRILPEVARDPAFERMFLDEARLAAALSHPGIVQILDVGRDDDGLFLVMEYLSGESLAYLFHHLRHAGDAMPWPLACRIGAQLAGALAAAHGASDELGRPRPIIHRDVTPSNVMVCWTGQAKLVDFGIARPLAGTRTMNGAIKGKLAYLSPEMARGRTVDARADVFQLGVVLHEILTGARLFDGATDFDKVDAVCHRPIHRPGALRRGLPAALDAVVLGALERDPAARTRSAELLRRGLEAVLRESGEPAGEADLGEWMRSRFPARLAERRRIERELLAGRSRAAVQVQPGAVPVEPPGAVPIALPRAVPVALPGAVPLTALVGDTSRTVPAGRRPLTPWREPPAVVVAVAAAPTVLAVERTAPAPGGPPPPAPPRFRATPLARPAGWPTRPPSRRHRLRLAALISLAGVLFGVALGFLVAPP
jgi:eukaryotic-like serine/threonine-protein kinase